MTETTPKLEHHDEEEGVEHNLSEPPKEEEELDENEGALQLPLLKPSRTATPSSTFREFTPVDSQEIYPVLRSTRYRR